MGNKASTKTTEVPKNSDFVYKATEGYIKPKRLDEDDVPLEGIHNRFSSEVNSSYAMQKISLKHIYGKRQHGEASQTETSNVIIAKHLRKKGQLGSLDIDEINAGYDRAVTKGNTKYNKRMVSEYSDQVTISMETNGKAKHSAYADGPEFSKEVSNTNDLPSRSEYSNIVHEKFLPDNIALKTLQSERPSLDFGQLLDKRISQVQNRISNFSKVSRISIDDFFVNIMSQRTSNTKLQKPASLESLLDDRDFISPEVSLPHTNQMPEPVQNRLAIAYKEIPVYFPKVSPQNKKPPLGASGLSIEPKKVSLVPESSVMKGVGPSESSLSVLEFETSLAIVNRTKVDTPNGVQRRVMRFPSKHKGPNGHLNNYGDDAVDTPIMTEENLLDGDYLSFSNFPNSNKASGNFEVKETHYTNEELQQRQQEWANNLPELEVIEVVEEMDEEDGEEDTPKHRQKTTREVTVGEKTIEAVGKLQPSKQLPPHVRKKIFEKYEQQAEHVKEDLVIQKKAEAAKGYSLALGRINTDQKLRGEKVYSLENVNTVDVQRRQIRNEIFDFEERTHTDTDFHMKPSIFTQTMDMRRRSPFAKEIAAGRTTSAERSTSGERIKIESQSERIHQKPPLFSNSTNGNSRMGYPPLYKQEDNKRHLRIERNTDNLQQKAVTEPGEESRALSNSRGRTHIREEPNLFQRIWEQLKI